MHKYTARFIAFLFFWSAILSIPAFCADTPRVAVLVNRELAPAFRALVDDFKKTLQDEYPQAVLREYPLSGDIGKDIEEVIKGKIRLDQTTLILVVGTYPAEVALKSISDIPVVYSGMLDPFQYPLVRDSVNAAGVDIEVPYPVQLQYYRKVLPAAQKIGVFYNPDSNQRRVDELTKVFSSQGLETVLFPVKDVKGINAVKQMDFDALLLIPDALVCQPLVIQQLMITAFKNRVPVLGISRVYVQAGALMALECDYAAAGRAAAAIAGRIIAGEPPNQIKLARLEQARYYINKKIAEQLNIAISAEIEKAAAQVYGKQ